MKDVSTSVRAAGGVVCRREDGEWFAVVVAPNGDAWRLPKGIVDAGETDEQAALREVAEETGLTSVIHTRLRETRWTYHYNGVDVEKTTRFFLMIATGGALAARNEAEIPRARWIKLTELEAALFFESERTVAREAVSLLARDPVTSS